MAQVTVTVNNRSYTLACDDGEEQHLTELAAQIDNRIAELTNEVGVASSDARLMLMASLVIADELAFANERITELEGELAALRDEDIAPPSLKALNGHSRVLDEDKVAGILESAARRMEDIAARLG